MKTKSFTLNNKELLLVEVQDHIRATFSMGYLILKVHNEANWCHDSVIEDPIKLQKYLDNHKPEKDYKDIPVKIPEGFELIGKLPELTEEQFAQLVDSSIHTGLSAHYVKGINPPNTYCYQAAKESFFSALEVEGILFENPFGKEPCQREDRFITVSGLCRTDMWKKELVRWQSAQEKVFNIDNTFLFEKV